MISTFSLKGPGRDLPKEIDSLDRRVSDIEEEMPIIGPKGPQGNPGKDGESIVGPQGEKGDPGYTPIKGVDYVDGKDGIGKVGPKGAKGEKGDPGKDGTCIDADEIRKFTAALITPILELPGKVGTLEVDESSLKDLRVPQFSEQTGKLHYVDLPSVIAEGVRTYGGRDKRYYRKEEVDAKIAAVAIAEADTLDTVTDRGAVTTNDITVGGVTVTDEAYGAGWDGSAKVPTKNAIYDKIESLAVGIPQLSADPVSPAAEDAWVLATIAGGSGGGVLTMLFGAMPITTVNTGGSQSYQLSYRTSEGSTKRVSLS